MKLHLPPIEVFNDSTQTFVTLEARDLEFEYSLYTVSLWESKWKKPFLSDFNKLTPTEKFYFLREMCITPDVPDIVWRFLPADFLKAFWEYVTDPHSASVIAAKAAPGKKRHERVTTELIYYWMASLGIPYECEHWHLNRLLKLIQIGFIKSTPPKKMSKRETAQMYRDLNSQRRKELNTRG